MQVGASACTGLQKSFCFVRASRIGEHVLCGVISNTTTHGIKLNIIDVLRGNETRSVVTIWDGTDFDCSGNVSMKTTLLGNVGDTIILLTPMIGGVPQNIWDVAGDYRMPYHLYETAWLKVTKDTVRGYIAGAANTPLLKYAYSNFKTYWLSHSNDCVALATKNIKQDNVNVSFNRQNLTINSTTDEAFLIKLFTLDGRLITTAYINKEQALNCAYLSSGIYIYTVSRDSETLIRKKFIL